MLFLNLRNRLLKNKVIERFDLILIVFNATFSNISAISWRRYRKMMNNY